MSVAEEAVTESPMRTYTEAGGLLWAFAGAWRCAAMMLVAHCLLASPSMQPHIWNYWDDTIFPSRILGDVFLYLRNTAGILAVVGFISFLVLGEEVAAGRIQRSFRQLADYALFGQVALTAGLYLFVLVIAGGQIFAPELWYNATNYELELRNLPNLWAMALPVIFAIATVWGIRRGVQCVPTEASEFVQRTIRETGAFTAKLGAIVAAAVFPIVGYPSQGWGAVERIVNALPGFLVPVGAAAGAGYVAALLSSCISLKTIPASCWQEVAVTMKRGAVFGGLGSLSLGFLRATWLTFGNSPNSKVGIINEIVPSMSELMISWLGSYCFSGAILIGVLLVVGLQIWKIRTAVPHSEVIQVNE